MSAHQIGFIQQNLRGPSSAVGAGDIRENKTHARGRGTWTDTVQSYRQGRRALVPQVTPPTPPKDPEGMALCEMVYK